MSKEELQEDTLLSHLIELRSRLLKAGSAVLVFFVVLAPFSDVVFKQVALPLMQKLPEGSTMIATQVASPFLTPFKTTMFAALFLAMPVVLFQLWSFAAPGLYKKEKKFAMPLLVSSVGLFYLGAAFAYVVVFPLMFGFFTSAAPAGVSVMTDISSYLDFVLVLFFAFGMAFEVPIATVILVWSGLTSIETLEKNRAYVFLGAFIVGMLITPPDVISQTLLAVPVYLLYECGILLSKVIKNKDNEET
jgi:sec-independent protein translocase protein TatC